MKKRNFAEVIKNAAGTMFLLAAAFFVCSTFLSMRAVLADPIAPAVTQAQARGAIQSPRSAIQSPRGTASTTANRSGATVAPGRAVASRTVGSRAVAPSRTVSSRANPSRAVVARTATTPGAARVSLTGPALRASGSGNNSSYTYLSSKLYTGNYSNIVDPSTGLISADAYANCMESYYTCMDEICTARNQAQRRCACAGRVKSFARAEIQLEQANEELIKVSGELALLIATKGKDVSAAFTLTDAEMVMNCVSYQDEWDRLYSDTDRAAKMVEWCQAHMMYDTNKCSYEHKPDYCSANGNNFGFDVGELSGTGSDILASLKSWATAKEATMTITDQEDEDLKTAWTDVISALGGLGVENMNENAADTDELSKKWGYDLFAFAHNEVCSRVLDSCFNGIYETCKSPCASGTSCGYNYNSDISVSGDNLVINTPGNNSGTAACFGYDPKSGDPYASLRGPVADARRSVLQKYALDANADCDLYGEQLRTTAQNIGYQKVAAQQALQQKRLEFAQEESAAILAAANAAGSNFSKCLSDTLDCYESAHAANATWSTSRVKTYCAQIASVPTCYDTMICNPSRDQFKAVIDVPDSQTCDRTLSANTNTKDACRNVVTLNEILNGTGEQALSQVPSSVTTLVNSAALREMCLQDSFVQEIRDWGKSATESKTN